MLHDVIAANYRSDYLIEIEFDDGNCGVVDFSKYVNRGGVFERFKDMEYFKRFTVDPELGVLIWEGGIDIAPETLYAEATGLGYPDWMEPEDSSEGNTKALKSVINQ